MILELGCSTSQTDHLAPHSLKAETDYAAVCTEELEIQFSMLPKIILRYS